MLVESIAFLNSQSLYDRLYYSPSRALRAAADWVFQSSAEKPVALLTSLGYYRASEFEWLCDGARLDPRSDRVIALIPYEAIRALDSARTGWRSFKEPEGQESVTLFEAQEPWLGRLKSAEAWLAPFWSSLNPFNHLEILKVISSALANPELRHPWVRTSLWWRRMTTASLLGKVDEKTLSELPAEPLIHAGPLYFPSYYIKKFDPQTGDELLRAALRLDPRLAKLR
jgi:hypothetical protein